MFSRDYLHKLNVSNGLKAKAPAVKKILMFYFCQLLEIFLGKIMVRH